MKTYHFEFISSDQVIEGKIKAGSYDIARQKVKAIYKNVEMHSLRVFRQKRSFFKPFLNIFLDIKILIFKLVPIAIGILLIYLLLNKCS